jgi:hypothetical protein
MSAISNVHAIHIVKCSWCNRLGHEQVNCPIWIGCIAHEREKQIRLKEMQVTDEYSPSKGALVAFLLEVLVAAVILAFTGIR